ncbi:MAG TPA: pseudouridine synthase [Chitinophagales bacterium]|nr:pseudouridine synthase [Chitinophagales bacterium]
MTNNEARFSEHPPASTTFVSLMKPKEEISSPQKQEGIQLNKFLSTAGIASRRSCAELIKEGNVKVNNKVITEPGYRVQPTDAVFFKGKKISFGDSGRKHYILLNKPKDIITTVSDERGRTTVMELIAKATSERVYPVGRLDRNTTGVLLLTNDGDLAQRLSHPSSRIKKVYQVTLDKELSIDDMRKVAEGIELEDGVAAVDEIAYAHPDDNRIVGIELHSGKNRIVRRIFEYLGYQVTKLDRVMYAGLTKKNLQRGKWRFLKPDEINLLKRTK